MTDTVGEAEQGKNVQALRSRRAILRVLAGAPLALTFGMVASPFMRFLKPTMKPGNFFQPSDLPAADQPPTFSLNDFPNVGSCLPFMFPMKYMVFNPEQYEIRKIPGFAIRIRENQIVAFSRICPRHHDHILNFVYPAANGSCGCADKSCVGVCIEHVKTPFLICPCDHSVYDVSDNGRALNGSMHYSARQFSIDRSGEWISVNGLEHVGIV